MAYVPIPQQEENQFGPQGITTPNPMASMPPQSSGSAGQAGGASPNTGSPTQIGSGASRLSDYLSANAPQIQQEGANIAGNLTNQFGQTQADIGTAGQGFQGQVNQSYTPMDQSLLGQAEANPTAVAANPQQTKEFQGMFSDQYTGPQNIETTAPYSNIQNEVSNAVSNAGLLKSPAGLSSYLNTNVEQNATPGMNTLDTALIQANPQAFTNIQNAAAPFSGLTGQFNKMTTAADQAAQQAQQVAQQTQQQTQAAFTGPGGVIPNFQAGTQQELTNAQNAAGQQEQQILQDISTGKVTPADLSALGITQDQWNQIQSQIQAEANPAMVQVYPGAPGVTPVPVNTAIAPYLSQLNPQTAIGLGNVLTPQDYATAKALQTLTGVNLNLPGDPAMPQLSTLNIQALQDYLNSVGQGQQQGAQAQSLQQENAKLAQQAAANQQQQQITNNMIANPVGQGITAGANALGNAIPGLQPITGPVGTATQELTNLAGQAISNPNALAGTSAGGAGAAAVGATTGDIINQGAAQMLQGAQEALGPGSAAIEGLGPMGAIAGLGYNAAANPTSIAGLPFTGVSDNPNVVAAQRVAEQGAMTDIVNALNQQGINITPTQLAGMIETGGTSRTGMPNTLSAYLENLPGVGTFNPTVAGGRRPQQATGLNPAMLAAIDPTTYAQQIYNSMTPEEQAVYPGGAQEVANSLINLYQGLGIQSNQPTRGIISQALNPSQIQAVPR